MSFSKEKPKNRNSNGKKWLHVMLKEGPDHRADPNVWEKREPHSYLPLREQMEAQDQEDRQDAADEEAEHVASDASDDEAVAEQAGPQDRAGQSGSRTAPGSRGHLAARHEAQRGRRKQQAQGQEHQ